MVIQCKLHFILFQKWQRGTMPRQSCLWQDISYCNSKYWLRTSKLNIQMHLIVVSSRICIYHVLQLLNYPVVLCESTVNRLYYCYLNINIYVYFLWNNKVYEYRIYICIQIYRKCNNVWLWLIFWLVDISLTFNLKFMFHKHVFH